MDEDIRFDWDSLVMLLPLCFDYYREWEQGNAIDIDDAMNQIGKALGCEDLNLSLPRKPRMLWRKDFRRHWGGRGFSKTCRAFRGNGKGCPAYSYEIREGRCR